MVVSAKTDDEAILEALRLGSFFGVFEDYFERASLSGSSSTKRWQERSGSKSGLTTQKCNFSQLFKLLELVSDENGRLGSDIFYSAKSDFPKQAEPEVDPVAHSVVVAVNSPPQLNVEGKSSPGCDGP